MDTPDIDALLITDPTNIRYLTGFVGVAPEEREAYVLQTEKTLYLFTNGLYIEQAKKLTDSSSFGPACRRGRVQRSSIKVIEISREDPLSKKLKEITTSLKIKTLDFEEINLSFAEYCKLKSELSGVELIATQNRIEKLREIKRDDEIVNIKKACEITDECFTYVVTKLKIGVTEEEIAWEIESFFRKSGATNAFSPIVAFGKNSSQPHYQPINDERLTNNEIVLLDFGARFNGYCADMTRMVFTGKPKDEWKNAYETVLKSQEAALEYIAQHAKANLTISGASVDQAAREVIAKSAFPVYPHSLGHAVGLAIHESPRLSVQKDAVLLPGMVFSVEPGTYIPNKFGIRIEDLVLLTKDGMETLSKSTKKLTILQ